MIARRAVRTPKPERKEKRRTGEVLALGRLAAQKQVSVYASSGAFYLFLALFPAAALICALLPLIPLTQTELFAYLSAVLPDFMEELLRIVVDDLYERRIGSISFSTVLLLWSSSRALAGLMKGLDVVYSGQCRRNYFRLRGLGSLYMLLLIIFLLLTLALNLGQQLLMQEVLRLWPGSGELLERLMKLRFLPVMLVLAVFFTSLYKYLPEGKRRWFRQVPGALLASAAWMLFGWAFSLYLKRFGADSVYGSLTTVAFALLWIFGSESLVLWGGCVNVWLADNRVQRDKA